MILRTFYRAWKKIIQRRVPQWYVHTSGIALLGLGIGLGTVLTMNNFWKQIFASDVTQTWDFATSSDYTIGDANLVEIAETSARLKVQNYISDADTMTLYHLEQASSSITDDDSSNGNDATTVNASFAEGVLNNGLVLNGTNAYASASDTASLSITQQNTLEAWVKFNQDFSATSHDQRQGVVDKGSYGLYFDQNNGKLNYTLSNNTTHDLVQVAGNDLNNSWDLNGKLSVGQLIVDGSNLYVGLGNAVGDAEVWKHDGSSWSKVGGDGLASSWADNTFEEVTALRMIGSTLYAGIGNTAGDAEVWSYNGTSWTKIGGDAVNASWALSTFERVTDFTSINTTLYASLGTTPAGDAEVWSWNGTTWTKIGGDGVNSSWNTNYEEAYSLASDGTNVYAGLSSTAGDAEVWRWNGSTWTKIGGDALNSSWADATFEYVLSMTYFGGNLYAGLGNSADDAEVWSFNGTAWTKIGGDSLNSGWTTTYEGVYGLVNDGTNLYASLGASAGDNEVWRWNGSAWTKIGGDAVNGSFTNTHTYIRGLAYGNSTLYAGLTSTTTSGEVWSFNGTTWTIMGGNYVNNSWGFYNLQSVESFANSGDKFYAGTGYTVAGNALVWEYDGSTWRVIGGQGNNGSWARNTYETVNTLIYYKGNLYAGLGSTANDAEVWRWDGSSWTQIGGDSLNSGWGINYEGVYSLAVYNDNLYAGLGASAQDAEIWRWNETAWTKVGGDGVASSWAAALNIEAVYSLTVYNGNLVAGLGATAGDSEVWSYNGTSWTKIGGDALNTSWSVAFEVVESLTVFNGKLYAGLGNSADDAEVWEYNGAAWSQIGGDGVASSWAAGEFERVRSMIVYNGELFASLGLTAGDGEVWRYSGSTWSKLAGDGLNGGWAAAVIESSGALNVFKGKLYMGTGDTANIDAGVWTYGNNGFLSSTVNTWDTNWHHIAATYDGSTMKLYIDGVLDNTVSTSLSLEDNTRPLLIGTMHGSRDNGTGQGFFGGMIDEARVSDVARTQFNSTPYSTEPQTVSATASVFATQVEEFDDFSVTEEANGGTITYRLSDDGSSTWKYWNGSSWTVSSSVSQANSASTIDTQIGSFPVTEDGITWQAILDGDGDQRVTLQSVAIGVLSDVTVPNNPDEVTALSEEGSEIELISNTWYGYDAPHFSWSGAEDPESGIAGYYVYFGTDATADPVTAGVFQTESDYTPTSLVANSTYYLRIKTRDNAYNISSTIWDGFTYKYDDGNPTNPNGITVTPAGYAATNNFTFEWPDATDGGSGIQGYQYKTGTASGTLADWSSTITETTVTIPDAAYQDNANTFYLRTVDNAGNVSTTSLQAIYYFAGEGPTAPQYVQVSPNSNTINSFAFSWEPPETYSGEEDELTYCYTINTTPSESSCVYTSSGATSLSADSFATQQGINTFYVAARNGSASGNSINYGAYASITFEANTSSPGIPLNLDIADISVKSKDEWSLVLKWVVPTDEGSGVDKYKVYRSTDNENFTEVGTSSETAFLNQGLSQIIYYYYVKACDSVNNCSAPSETVSMYPDGKYTEAPSLTSDPQVSAVTTKTASISWATDRQSDSKVQYGLKADDFFSSEPSNSLQKTDHTIELANLQPGMTYYYKTKWTDEDGNTGESDTATFKTLPPPSVQDVTIKSLGLDVATVEFTVSGANSVKVMYGKTTGFGGVKELGTSAASSTYTVTLDELEDGTKYFYKVNAYDAEGSEYEGTILSFETLPRPQISTIRVQQVKGTAQPSVLVSWSSNTPISSIVTYYPESQPTLSRDEVNITLQNGQHKMLLKGLQPQTSYILIVKGRDKAGNEAISEVQRLTTATDTRPPQVSNLKVETSTITPNGSDQAVSQLIVSWDTDEPATSQVDFAEGTGTTYQQKTQEDKNLTYNHVVVVGNLSPSKVYHLRAVSRDSASNEGSSVDTVIITAKATDNALDLVVSNLQNAFGFLKKIQ